MSDLANARNSSLLLCILLTSAVGMLWLFWHHPVPTSIATVAVLAALAVSVALARSSDTDGVAVIDQTEIAHFQ